MVAQHTFMDEILTPAFLTGFFAIIGIDIILSGENAVVIALAARSLPAFHWSSSAAARTIAKSGMEPRAIAPE